MGLDQSSLSWPADKPIGQAGEGTDEYRKRVESEILRGILRASGASDAKAPVILSAKIIDACLNTIAYFAAVTREGATPEFADKLADQLREKLRAVSTDAAADTLDFLRIVPGEGPRM
jgi:hypothetical protein